MLNHLRDYIVVTFLLLIVATFWVAFILIKSIVLVPVGIMAICTKESQLFGTKIEWRRWLRDMVISDNQSVNTMLGGDRNVSISSRVGHHAVQGNSMALKMEKFINIIFFWEDNHCRKCSKNNQKF
jgi:hypothetical protein